MAIGPVTTGLDRRAVRCAMAATLLCLLALAVFWPGYVAYDSVTQYRQALTGRYDDWHPPAMARLWSLFGDAGPGPMLVVQMALYWLGFGLLAAALAAGGRGRAAVALLIAALWPPLLGWQAVVLKDTQMLGPLLGAVGIVGWWRLRDRPVPPAGRALIVPLLVYAVLVRANAVFAVVPLAAMLVHRPRRWSLRLGIALAGIVLAIGVSGPINHRLFGGAPSGVERTQAIYDLAGIGVRTRDPRVGMPAAALAGMAAKGCVRPFFWDPLGEPARCAAEVDGLRAMPVAQLYGTLAAAIVRHPLAYAAHRLAHLNSTGRWLVPLHWFGAAPPEGSEANDFGFGAPGPAAWYWQRLAGWLVETPPGWPVLWLVLAAGGVAATIRARDAAGQLARALFVSALTLEASFAAISIASDLRYHVWTMAAVAIGWVLVGSVPRSRLLRAVLAVALLGGTGARLLLPEAPQSYHGMLG
ncbi:hypothetical protein LPN01_06925 [Sphingomonas sp. A2-49]|uniref:hypothetical protein n=1 Tax=Sphingomonas sp. A2-49 TaxID=1391375 RepID=UPI0021D37DE3|nr:hypothetical protein [Sphingomonas sp. A2-49]MCU6453806.1 hypothetical protein [Sphingomonas sp. A2-49]